MRGFSAVVVAGLAVSFGFLVRRRREEAPLNAPLRSAIETRVSFGTRLDRASVLGTGGFGGTRGAWISLRGPKRLVVGTDAFMVSAPQALRDFVFRGRESSIALSQAPSRVANRDWIVITGQSGGRQVQLAITRDNLPEIWLALAGTGVSLVPAAGEFEQPGTFAYGVGRVTGWRRVAAAFASLALLMFGPALVLFVARHL